MRFRKGQMVKLKKWSELKPEYRGVAGVIVQTHKHYLTIKVYKGLLSAVRREDVAMIL